MYQNWWDDIAEEIREEVLEEGIEKGIEKGCNQEKISMIVQMKKIGMPMETICQVAFMTKEQVEAAIAH